MSKEEFLKIQTCVLKVNIHCDGCQQKVKKILQKIDGVFTTRIDAEQGKVTVSGNVDPAVLIKKLGKSGKHAELWGAQKASNNNNQNQNQNQSVKNTQIDNGKGGNKKGQKGSNNNNNQLPKGGQLNQLQQNPQLQQQLQQLLQLQQMKRAQDLKLPNMPNQQDFSDDGLDEFDDEDDDFDDYELDEMDAPYHHHPLNKMKPPVMVNVPQGLNNMTMNGMPPQAMNAQKGAPNAGGNGKKAGGGGASGNGAVPVQLNVGGKKGGGGGGSTNNGGNQNQGGKNGGGKPQESKNGNGGGGGNNMNMNGAKKGNNDNAGGGAANGGFHNMGGPYGNMGQMGNISLPMGQMGNVPAVQGLPATAMGGGGGGGGYFQGAGPDLMPGNPLHAQQQQYLAAAMMNPQRAMGNERFQAMMYARPQPAVNYMPQYPYPYGPYPPPQLHGSDPYSSFFSDENASSCNVM